MPHRIIPQSPDEPTIYHWDGFAWTKGVAIGTLNNLNSVFMVNSGDVWTVGGGSHSTSSCTSGAGVLCPIILHYTGGSWNSISPPPGSYVLRSIFMVNSGEGWAVGAQTSTSGTPTGIILHYEVTAGVGTWGVFPSPTTSTPIPALESVFMLNQYEGWAVGDDATILHYTVSGGIGTWSLVSVSGTPTLITIRKLDLNIHVVTYEWMGRRRNSSSTTDGSAAQRSSRAGDNLLGRNKMGARRCAQYSWRYFSLWAHGWDAKISILHEARPTVGRLVFQVTM